MRRVKIRDCRRRDFSKQEDRIYERWSFKSEIPSLFRFWDDEMLACKRRDEVVLPEIVLSKIVRNSYDRFAIFSIAYKGVSEICHLHTNLMMSACVKMDFY